jgi:hypothetical protein
MVLAKKNPGINQQNVLEDKYTTAATDIWFLPKVPKMHTGEKTVSLTNSAGKTGHSYIENWTRSMPLTLYKNQFKMDQRS